MNFLNERKLPLDVPLGALLLLSETRIACVDATEFLSDVYIIVHERQTHIALRNSDNELNFFAVYKLVHKKNQLLIVATGTN